jgi:hypothetical protein
LTPLPSFVISSLDSDSLSTANSSSSLVLLKSDDDNDTEEYSSHSTQQSLSYCDEIMSFDQITSSSVLITSSIKAEKSECDFDSNLSDQTSSQYSFGIVSDDNSL